MSEGPPLPRALGISLARRPARQKAFVARAAEARVPLELCDAVDGRAMDRLPAGVALYRGWCLAGHANRFFSRELKWGEVGCGLSHAAAWADIAASDAPVAVLEDDAEFAPGFADLVRAALREVAALEAAGEIAPPDLLYLGRRAMAPAADRLLPRAAAAGGSSAPAPPASPRLVVQDDGVRAVAARRGEAAAGAVPRSARPRGRAAAHALLPARRRAWPRARRLGRAVRRCAATRRARRPAVLGVGAPRLERHRGVG